MTTTLNLAAGLALYLGTTWLITRPLADRRRLTTLEWWVGLTVAGVVALLRARWLLS